MQEPVNLTSEQLKALEEGHPVSVVIDTTRCVVVRQDVFERVQRAIAEDHAELRAIFARAAESSDWNDPKMDVYDHYEQG
jgi:uncharacterized protein YgbK (DUF1537 family)